ncbi:MAG: hypothetical protein V4525_01975 [Pseudomonadota bacterium]
MASLSSQKADKHADKQADKQNVYQALENWNNYSAQSIQNMKVVFEAITPFKDAVQLTGQTVEMFSRLNNWESCSKKSFDGYGALNAYYELLNIQSASLNLLTQDNSQYLKNAIDCSAKWAESLTPCSNPEELVSSSINTSIAIMKQYQNILNNQVQHLSSIQSAYTAWFQKTFFQA